MRIINRMFLFLFLTTAASGQSIKIATYNIYFLDAGISSERQANLKQVIAELNADVIAFQEINNRAALENILPDSYKIAIIDAKDEVQEVALAVRQPLKIHSSKFIYADEKFDNAFPRSRNLLQVEVEWKAARYFFLVCHAKSRRGGRAETDARREEASALIVDHIKANLADKNVIVLGDFNDNPDDRSMNILEYGDANAPGGIDTKEDSFLFNTSEDFLNSDFCSFGYNYLFKDTELDTFELTILGAARENNKWRGQKNVDYYRDVRVKAILFDQILVSKNLQNRVGQSGVFNKSVAVRGQSSRIKFQDGELIYTRRGAFASDHVPVWMVLN